MSPCVERRRCRRPPPGPPWRRRAPRPRPGCSGRPAAVLPIRPGCGVPSPVAPTPTWLSPRQPTTGSDRCSGGRSAPPARDELGPERAVLGGMADALKMEALLLLPHAVAHGGAPPDRGRARTGRVQGAGGGRPLPRSGAAADGGHRPPAPARRPRARARRAARRGVAGDPPRRRRPLRHRARARRRALTGPRAPLRTRSRLPARHRARSRGALGQAPAARGRGDASLRTPAGRRARGAVGSRRKAAPRIRPPGLDRRPGHDRGRRGPARCAGRLGPRARRRRTPCAARPSSAPRSHWHDTPAWTRRRTLPAAPARLARRRHAPAHLGLVAAHPPRAAGVPAELRADRRADAAGQDPARAPRLGPSRRHAGPCAGRPAAPSRPRAAPRPV